MSVSRHASTKRCHASRSRLLNHRLWHQPYSTVSPHLVDDAAASLLCVPLVISAAPAAARQCHAQHAFHWHRCTSTLFIALLYACPTPRRHHTLTCTDSHWIVITGSVDGLLSVTDRPPPPLLHTATAPPPTQLAPVISRPCYTALLCSCLSIPFIAPAIMSRPPTSRFPPPVLFQQSAVPPKSAAAYRPSASSPVLYDSDSYDEDGGSFQLLPSPEHYINGAGTSPLPATRKAATQPVLYDEEEELVSPSSSYTNMSPSASLEQLPAPVQSERKKVAADVGGGGAADSSRSRVQVGRNNRVQHRNALRLDLMDADEDETLNEEDEESELQQRQRHRDTSHANAAQPVGQSKQRPSTLFSTPPLSASAMSSASSSLSAALPTPSISRTADLHPASTAPVPVPTRSTHPSHHLAPSTSDVSLPSSSFDEYNDSILAGHSLNDLPAKRFEHMRRSTRDDYDEDDEGGFEHSADVIELEDEERERESSGSAGKASQRSGRAQSETHAVAAPPTERRSSPSPQLVPLLASHPPPLHHSSASSIASSVPTTSPALLTSSSVPIMLQSSSSRSLRTVVPMTIRTSSASPLDDEGEDGDDEHDDQHNEERDDTSSAVISIPAGTQDKHDAVRSFNGAASSPSLLRTLTSSYSMQPPSVSHNASTSSTSSAASSSSSSSSHVSAVTELLASPPSSGTEDGDGEVDEFNDGDVMIVNSPHHSHSPSRAHQQPGQATDEDDESEPAFRLQEQEEETEPQPRPQTPLLLPAALTPSSSATPSRRPSGVSIAADEDEFAEAKLRREKLIAGKAARLARKSKHERWDMDSSVRRDSKHRSAASKASQRSKEREDESDDSSQSSDSSSSSSSATERSDDERREAEENRDRARDVDSQSSNRRSPAPNTSSATPPSPARPFASQPSSRSASPVKAAYRQYQHDDPYYQQQHQPQHYDEAAAAHRHTSTKQRAERRPSDTSSLESSPLPPSHPLTLSRTGSHSSSSRSLKKKKRGSSEDEIRVADLEFKEKIGEGAYGDVYRGYLWGQEVAIKQIRLVGGKEEAEEETVREFRREMKIMKHLRHPNVVEFLGACMSEHSLCLLTEYMPNGSLEDHLTRLRREGRRMRESRVVSLSLDVVKGLNWLHHKGIIHRDLKSANILLDSAGKCKISDFGLSHVRRRRDESMDGYHGVAGTPSYIAPEVLMGREYGVKADVYSLGVLINEMLATVAPYDDTPLAQLDLPAFEAAVMAGGRPTLAECHNAALTQLIVECWQSDADSRPTVESIMKTLERTDRDMQTQQQQQLIAHAAEAAEAATSSLDDLPTPLRSLLANDYARLYQLQAALAEQERQLQARSAAMASEKAAREEEHKQWEQTRDRHKLDDGDEKTKGQKA